MRVLGMRPGISITLKRRDRSRLEAIVGDRNAPQKQVWRAAIVLLSADGLGSVEIMRRTGKSKTCVWRWQERFAEGGVDSLLRDKTRPSRVKPLGQEVIAKVVALTATEPPHEATHWTGVAMATAPECARKRRAAARVPWPLPRRPRPAWRGHGCDRPC